MISFYGFFTTYYAIMCIMSCISIGFISQISNSKSSADKTQCNVNFHSVTYNLYYIVLILLIGKILQSILQVVGYVCTKKYDSSIARKFIILIISLIYVFIVVCAVMMVIKFHDNNSCFNFYNHSDNGKNILLGTFIGLCITFILEFLFAIIGLITMCLCSENTYDNTYENKYILM